MPAHPKPIRVALGARSYEIRVGVHLLHKLGHFLKSLKDVTNVMIVANAQVASYHIRALQSSMLGTGLKYEVHLVPDGEQAKSAKELFGIYQHLLRFRADRDSVVVAFGGGVVGDVTGFAASTFMRGIRWIQVPTTLLAQVDSAIGGKTAINLAEGKNLIGSFYQPSLVLSDIALLETLPRQERANSLSEIIKYGVISGERFFRYLEQHVSGLLEMNMKPLTHVVSVASRIKADIVSRDERETTGLRMHLNLGHTFAHAFERVGGYEKVSHGHAVALGLIAASKVSERKGWVSGAFTNRISRLIARAELPTSLSGLGLKPGGVLEAMEYDKKKKKGRLRLVLPRALGKLVVTDQVTPKMLKTVLHDCAY